MNGKYIRIYCHDCKKKITINHKQEKTNKLLRNHLNRNSYRILEDEQEISKKAACTLVNQATEGLIHSNELTKLLKPQNYSGTLLIDGKYVPVKETSEEKVPGFIPRSAKRRGKTKKGLVAVVCIDYLTHDIPVYDVCLSENSFDMRKIFLKLKEIGYPLKIVICDETMGQIAEVAKEVFPEVIIQICLTHYSKTIERIFVAGAAKRTYRSLQKQLDFLGESFFIRTHYLDREKAVKLINQMADLEFEYGYLWQIQELFHDLFWKVDGVQELADWENNFNERIALMNLKNYPYAKKIQDRYRDYYEKREQITASILHPERDIPRTTNLIEGWNSTTMELRISSIRGFKKEKYARNYINAIILKYRFHKFKDCKTKFKTLNGKSPLQIAQLLNTLGFDFHSDDWIVFCKNLKRNSKNRP
jgi:hypothetical protein